VCAGQTVAGGRGGDVVEVGEDGVVEARRLQGWVMSRRRSAGQVGREEASRRRRRRARDRRRGTLLLRRRVHVAVQTAVVVEAG